MNVDLSLIGKLYKHKAFEVDIEYPGGMKSTLYGHFSSIIYRIEYDLEEWGEIFVNIKLIKDKTLFSGYLNDWGKH